MLQINLDTLRYGKNVILNPFSMTLPTNRCIGLLGSNGAGKSTLLKAISQELHYKGEILWEGKNLARYSPNQRAKTMGFLTQHSLLSFSFSALEVVLLGRIMHDTSNSKNREIAIQIMQKLDIEPLIFRDYLSLSGGEKQRVHAARVWAQLYNETDTSPKLLLLDEPTSALDLKHQHQLLQQANYYAEQGNTVLVTLHDLNLAARYCQHLILLHDKNTLASGRPFEVLSRKNIFSAYGYEAKVTHQGEHFLVY